MSKHSLINLKELFPGTADNFFAPWSEWLQRNNPFTYTTIPALNIVDDKDHYEVTVAAPGLEKSDFNIEIDNNVLTVSATSEKEHEGGKGKYRRKEYNYSSFARSFTLPADVNVESIKASYSKGILSLNLPKNEKGGNKQGKKIEVK